jgi:hypothetical protein
MLKEKVQGLQPEAESTDAPVRDGLLCSSVEAAVMAVERREGVTRIEIISQRETGGACGFRWKAAAFGGWHEPYDARVSRTVL